LSYKLGVQPEDIYVVRLAGGFGNFASLDNARRPAILADIDLGLRKGNLKLIVGVNHTISVSDRNGCAGYIDAGPDFESHFKDPKEAQEWMRNELGTAREFLATWLEGKGHQSFPIKTFLATFEGSANIFEEVIAKEMAVS
jgi:hypothetical protein